MNSTEKKINIVKENLNLFYNLVPTPEKRIFNWKQIPFNNIHQENYFVPTLCQSIFAYWKREKLGGQTIFNN